MSTGKRPLPSPSTQGPSSAFNLGGGGVGPGGVEYAKFPKQQLKELCRDRGLLVGGNMETLIGRLVNLDNGGPGTALAPQATVGLASIANPPATPTAAAAAAAAANVAAAAAAAKRMRKAQSPKPKQPSQPPQQQHHPHAHQHPHQHQHQHQRVGGGKGVSPPGKGNNGNTGNINNVNAINPFDRLIGGAALPKTPAARQPGV
jgi:hypothetical protein